MSEAILLPQFIPPQVDLSGYALANHTHTPASIGAASSSHSHSGYLTSGSLSGYATQYWVTQNFAPKGSGGSTGGGSGSATKTFELPVNYTSTPTSSITTLGETSISHSAGSCTLYFIDIIMGSTTYSAQMGGTPLATLYPAKSLSSSERIIWSPGVPHNYAKYGNICASYDGNTLKVRYESYQYTYEYGGAMDGYVVLPNGSKISLKAVFS